MFSPPVVWYLGTYLGRLRSVVAGRHVGLDVPPLERFSGPNIAPTEKKESHQIPIGAPLSDRDSKAKVQISFLSRSTKSSCTCIASPQHRRNGRTIDAQGHPRGPRKLTPFDLCHHDTHSHISSFSLSRVLQANQMMFRMAGLPAWLPPWRSTFENKLIR